MLLIASDNDRQNIGSLSEQKAPSRNHKEVFFLTARSLSQEKSKRWMKCAEKEKKKQFFYNMGVMTEFLANEKCHI